MKIKFHNSLFLKPFPQLPWKEKEKGWIERISSKEVIVRFSGIPKINELIVRHDYTFLWYYQEGPRFFVKTYLNKEGSVISK